MKPFFELPELLDLNGEAFSTILGFAGPGSGCGGGCKDGCCNGCDAGSGTGEPVEMKPPVG